MSIQPQAHDIKQQVRNRFSDVAANYRTSKVHAAGPDLDLLVASAPGHPDAIVLDAGCGAGHTALAFADSAGQVIALDFTQSMLDQVTTLLQERGIENVVAQLGDVEQLPFPDQTFDAVVSRYSAHHWSRPQQALAEFHRVLKPQGCLLISDIMARENYPQDTVLQTIELLRDPSHVRDYRVSEWRALLATVGFRSELLTTFDLTLHFETWTRRMATPRQNAEMIKSLFRAASSDIRRAFALPVEISNDDFTFDIPGAVIRGLIAPGPPD